MSPQTRAAFSYVSAQIDTITAHPSCPGVVRTGMNVARDLVSCDLAERSALSDSFASRCDDTAQVCCSKVSLPEMQEPMETRMPQRLHVDSSHSRQSAQP